jgi:poly-gamma-glutamate capsule biosynthesis protein CapA/YwtB (metallophosphatase superfamily)
LVYAGIDVVSIANNHTLDYGLSALQQMQNNLRQNGIAFSGAGADSYEAYSPIIMSRNGLSFAFLASSDRTGQYNNAQPYLQADITNPALPI